MSVNFRLRITLLLFGCMLAFEAVSQIRVYPLPRNESTRIHPTRRSQALSAVPLPFWDDFSFVTQFPSDTLWEYGRTVTVHPGMGRNQPTLNVATFDGLDENGRPYSQNNILAKGLTDSLVSRPLRLDQVIGLSRDSVYLSFFYQYTGYGEPPDPEDKLTLSFLDTASQWVRVWFIEGSASLAQDIFAPVHVKVSGDAFFHEGFRFRIQSEGRQSGPYDTWNIDYVYINRGRTADDIIPDRAIAEPLSPLFSGYWGMPLDHYLTDPASETITPEFVLLNLKDGFSQPINYSSWATIENFTGGSVNTINRNLDTAFPVGSALDPFERTVVPLNTLPDPADFDPGADSVRIRVKVGVSTKDNIPPGSAGDYLPGFTPIDFRVNDTTQVQYTLANYYAYDDGVAEYGAGLNLPGGQLAYEFEMAIPSPDTVVAIDFYFPEFGNPANQVIRLFLLKDLLGNTDSELHSEAPVTIRRTGNNRFYTHTLQRPVTVQTKFYVGWQQSTASDLAVGLDKNTGTGDKIFYNTTGLWVQNTAVQGSLMIRPRFGKGDGLITQLPEITRDPIYPNPANDFLVLPAEASGIQFFDVSGRAADVSSEPSADATRVHVGHLPQGLYVVRFATSRGVRREKLVIAR
jgi:hypothetical protein